jgi:hypothetical protein
VKLALYLSVLFVLIAAVFMTDASAKGPVYLDPEKADRDFGYQGEYAGSTKAGDQEMRFGIQVVALGAGKFHAMSYVGGLPGEGGKERRVMTGELKDGVVIFDDEKGHGELKDGILAISAKNSDLKAELKKIDRKSPTLGQKPPEGATVLFDGSTADPWKGGRIEEGLLVAGCTSKQAFGSHKLHIEFRLPYQPEDQGQARGNSGIYLQGRYEVQMLDSFGLEGKQNECGGIYSVKDPDINMCFPPLAWQTYDIEYLTAKYENGKLVANPRVTVQHNGVKIHDNVELPGDRSTTAAPMKPGPEPGPIYLQDHGNPVRYRNIWVVPLND